jgi:hypothetical protein
MMAVWQLIPIDLLDPNWEASSHRGTVLVRARSKAAARALAAESFTIATRFPPGHGVKAPPWTRSSLVKVERVEDARYPARGPDEVLDPVP